ncbi:X2-like carbohydrate binding domain-containing protein, partial [Bacillus sp. FJAT-27264]|uniref:X2-like carbohydrate binding domain-containing protein n=1 Tax=Paenibacillus sp. (strain DSM 101736 / FJAT-27264) TaxID=1850362 RepID=UPI003369DC16
MTVSDSTPKNSELSTNSANFDKKTSAQADVNVTLTLKGNALSSIKNGTTALVLGTDYTLTNDVVTLKKEYLALLPEGITNLVFTFSAGNPQTLVITVSDSTPKNSELSTNSANFDKKTSAQADVSVTLTLKGNTLSSIKNGATALVLGTDYTLTNEVVTLKKEYLASLPEGITNLVFAFSAGNPQTLAITVSDSTPKNSELSTNSANFDKKTSAQADVNVTLTLKGNALSSIKNGTTALVLGTDYTLTNDVVTLKKEYLALLPEGITNLVFTFSAGNPQTLVITVSDSTPKNSELSTNSANFDKKTSAQADVSVTLTLKGNTLSSIKNGATALVLGTDYTLTNEVVTLKKEYLASLPEGITNLVFAFSAGNPQTLAITVSDSTPKNSELSTNSANFDKKTSAQADVNVTLTLKGNALSSIKNGTTALVLGTDYTLTNDVVTLKKEYLALLPEGITNLVFTFSAGNPQTLAITVSDSTPKNSELSTTTANFDKKTSAQADVSVTLTLKSNTLSSIQNGTTALVLG